jgi:1-deoxy-D-xylulose-5-phosphate synthase
MGETHHRLAAITAAMPEGTGLAEFARTYPERFFDVGIAEEHAVSFAAGLALGGLLPVVAIYSSFLQRSVDQILHDVCMQNLHVILAVDRAGLVGADGETHQGAFDLSYLSMMPNMTILAPKNAWELEAMLSFAIQHDGPIAIRYPRGKAYTGLSDAKADIRYGRSEVLHRGSCVAILAVGSMVEICEDVYQNLKNRGISVTLVNARFVKPLDTELIDELAEDHTVLVTVEENVKNGGYGEHVTSYVEACQPHVHVVNLAIWDHFVEHGSVNSLRAKVGLSADGILEVLDEYLNV